MIAIGAPVHEREWILPQWLDRLAAQRGYPASELTVILNYGPSLDDTLGVICRERRFAKIVLIQTPDVPHYADRDWSLPRYETMALLRNDLLRVVRDLKPDLFLSCDTDMLLPPSTLGALVAELDAGSYDGVAPLTYMAEYGPESPNYLTEDLRRTEIPPGTSEQYAVFGTVLMTPALYAIDYQPHPWGEDLGWAANVKATGLRLALAPDIKVKHCMNQRMLTTLDPRIGF